MSILNNWNKFVDRFQQKQTTTWAASLAFYTALSLAPLLMLFLIVSSQLGADLQNVFLNQIDNLMGSQASDAVAAIIASSQSRPDLMSVSGTVSILILLLSASLIFGELRTALNVIFDKPEVTENFTFLHSTWLFFKVRVLQMGLVLGFLFIMIVSLVISTAISASLTRNESLLGATLNIIFSGALYQFLFTILFHFLPEERVSWRRSFYGGAISAALFVIGKEFIGIYLGRSALSSSYGAAGSILVLLGWVYYSAIIIFVGAHASFLLHARKKLTH